MDLSLLKIEDLRAFQEQVASELRRRDQLERESAIERMHAIAKSVGVPLRDLVASSMRHRRGPQPIRFQHPKDHELIWTGLGRRPKWVAEWTSNGKSIDELWIDVR